jgi:hypothetical protein
VVDFGNRAQFPLPSEEVKFYCMEKCYMVPLIGRVVAKISSSKISGSLLSKLRSVFGFEVTTAQGVIEAVKNNPITAAFVLYELYGMGEPLLQELLASDSNVRESFDLLTYKPDAVDDSATDVTRYADEFKIIKEAIAYYGSLNNYLNAKRAMEMPDDVIRLYVSLKPMF